jgi:hypothetical protein
MDTPTALRNRSVFRDKLAALGYVEGKNILIEDHSAEGSTERLSELARELVASQPGQGFSERVCDAPRHSSRRTSGHGGSDDG